MDHNFQKIRCKECTKIIGELAHGIGRYWCKSCKKYTVVEIKKPLYDAGTLNVPLKQQTG